MRSAIANGGEVRRLRKADEHPINGRRGRTLSTRPPARPFFQTPHAYPGHEIKSDSVPPHGATTLIVNCKVRRGRAAGSERSVFTFLGTLCGWDGLTVHGLRHTVGTIMGEKLADVVQAINEHLTGTKLSNSADWGVSNRALLAH